MHTIWKMISILSFGLLGYQAFFEKQTIVEEDRQPNEYEYSEYVRSIAEEMPRFPGCENSGISTREKQSCANQKMLEFVYSNIRYPRGSGCVEGTSVAQCTIQKDGRLTEIIMRKSLSPQFDKEIITMLKKMPRWIPAKQLGKEVVLRFTLPVKIRLE